MRKLYAFLAIIILSAITPGFLRAESITAQDTIKSDVTWSADTVKVMSSMFIWDDVTLTIEPGTRVEFHGPHYIHVHGTVKAIGTKQDTIVFTSADTTGFWDDSVLDGSWNGFFFNNGITGEGADGAMNDNDSSIFRYCLIEYVKTSQTEGVCWSAISCQLFSRLVLVNCEIRYNYSGSVGGAIGLSSESDIKIYNNHIHHNRAYEWGGAIYSRNNTSKIRGNLIEHNSTVSTHWEHGKGGAIGILGMSPVIEDNVIRFNSGIYGSGIYLFNCFGRIEGNKISYNTGYNNPPDVMECFGGGIYAEGGSTAKVINNRIANNQADVGAGICVYNGDIEVIGNLIVNNEAALSNGAISGSSFEGVIMNNTIVNNKAGETAAIGLEDAEPLFLNNIVWNNEDPGDKPIKLLGYFAKLHVVNSVIEDGLASFSGESQPEISNMFTDPPAFVQPVLTAGAGVPGLMGKWWVRDTSVCINAGTETDEVKIPPRDLRNANRVLHSIIDIGAFETWIPSITAADTIKENTTWIADTVKVESDLVIMDDITLTILPGTRVMFTDTFQVQVIGTLIAAGKPGNRIKFTVADTTGNFDPNSHAGSWQGIRFENDLEGLNAVMDDNETSVLKYCDFSYFKAIEAYEPFRFAAVYVRYFDSLSISNCRFFNNYNFYEGASVNLQKSDLYIKDSEFFNNYSSQGSAIWTENCELMVEYCNFHDNIAAHRGAAICTNGGELTVQNSTFKYNFCGQRGGAIHTERTNSFISHSWFINNHANSRGGALSLNYENFQLINNLMVNNTGNSGGALYCLYIDDGLTMNNTIANNWATWGGGIANAFVNHTSVNDILYGNGADGGGAQYNLYSTSADLVFRNTLLEGGIDSIDFYLGMELEGSFENILDTDPVFARASAGQGVDFDGMDANWHIKSVSPCVNSGTLDGPAYLVEQDIKGKPRVHDTIIDRGAIENQWGPPEVARQPDNYIGCAGDSAVFRTWSRFEAFFQWQKDGEDIPGATENRLVIYDISADDDGNYKCLVSNAFGTVETNPAYLLARSAPEFVRQPQSMWAVEGEKAILSSTAIGTQPLHIQWFKDGNPIPNRTWPDLWIQDPDASDEGLYQVEVTNACATVLSDEAQVYLAPQICMVTVDTATGDNLVVWEKKSSAPIASYNIYRESIVAGEYEVIGNVPANKLSVYSDTAADPPAQAYIYKITAVMANGWESNIDLCSPHKTIHLLTSLNTEFNVAQLDWDHYYGFVYGTFHIYRSIDDFPFAIVHSMASSTTTWLDKGAPDKDSIYYRISVESPVACSPTGTGKAGTGPYTHSLSNLDDNKLKESDTTTAVVDAMADRELNIYPNPFSERTTVEFSNPDYEEYRVVVRDLSGKVMIMDLTTESRYYIERGNLPTGLYTIELVGKKIYRDRFMIR